jgi:hypothetical protein
VLESCVALQFIAKIRSKKNRFQIENFAPPSNFLVDDFAVLSMWFLFKVALPVVEGGMLI